MNCLVAALGMEELAGVTAIDCSVAAIEAVVLPPVPPPPPPPQDANTTSPAIAMILPSVIKRKRCPLPSASLLRGICSCMTFLPYSLFVLFLPA